jgi:hypothetical protein
MENGRLWQPQKCIFFSAHALGLRHAWSMRRAEKKKGRNERP